MGNPELARNDAGSHAGRCHLDDFQPDVVGQRAAVDEHATQLVHSTLTCNYTNETDMLDIVQLIF